MGEYTCPHCSGSFKSDALDVLKMQGGGIVGPGMDCPSCGKEMDIKKLTSGGGMWETAGAVLGGILLIIILVAFVSWLGRSS